MQNQANRSEINIADVICRLPTTMAFADLSGSYPGDPDWATLCQYVLTLDEGVGISDDFATNYQAAAEHGPTELSDAMCWDMLDNYIKGAFAAIRLNVSRNTPLIAWNALNRYQFPGLSGEISVLRTLIWGGFDVNAPSSGGATALHLFCRLQYLPVANPRAIRLLLKNGANPNVQTSHGDTALHMLAANTVWTPQCEEAYELLIKYGADASIVASDGETFRSLLESAQLQNPLRPREKFISTL